MFKKLNTKTLIIVLVLLIGFVAWNKYQAKKSESTFRDVFVDIDTSAVSQVIIYPKAEKGKEVKLAKTASGWELQSDKIKAAADTAAVRGLLASFVKVKSLSLAAEDESGWNDLQVGDTSGTRIKIITKDKTYDMVIGKFGYNQEAQNGITYIRHANEQQVYSIGGFLSMMIGQGPGSWRIKTFITGNKANWNSLTFTYPHDSSFVLQKQGNAWLVNGNAADSAKTEQYLTTISNLQNMGFADQYAPAAPPVFTLTISGNNQPAPITVHAYQADSVDKYILHSSLNPGAYFSESKSHLAQQVFVGKGYFQQYNP